MRSQSYARTALRLFQNSRKTVANRNAKRKRKSVRYWYVIILCKLCYLHIKTVYINWVGLFIWGYKMSGFHQQNQKTCKGSLLSQKLKNKHECFMGNILSRLIMYINQSVFWGSWIKYIWLRMSVQSFIQQDRVTVSSHGGEVRLNKVLWIAYLLDTNTSCHWTLEPAESS